MHTKSFWNAVKTFVSHKGAISNENRIIKAQKKGKIKVRESENELKIDANELIKADETLVELFNNHYINMHTEKTSRLAPTCIGKTENLNLDKSTVLDIIGKYKDHPYITKIKELGINKISFEFLKATMEDSTKLLGN